MEIQAIELAVGLLLLFQVTAFIMSSERSLRTAYAASWRATGVVIAHLLQIQRRDDDEDRWIGAVAFGLVALGATLLAALVIAGRTGF